MWYKIIDIRKDKKTKKWAKILAIAGGVAVVFAALAILYKKFNDCCRACEELNCDCDECDDFIEEEETTVEDIDEKSSVDISDEDIEELFDKDEM